MRAFQCACVRSTETHQPRRGREPRRAGERAFACARVAPSPVLLGSFQPNFDTHFEGPNKISKAEPQPIIHASPRVALLASGPPMSSAKAVTFLDRSGSSAGEAPLPKLLGRHRELSEPPRPRRKLNEAFGADSRATTMATTTFGTATFEDCGAGGASVFSGASTIMMSSAEPSVLSKGGLRSGAYMRAHSAPCKKGFSDDDESVESTEIPPTTEGWDETTEGGYSPIEEARALAMRTHRAVFRQRTQRSLSRNMRSESRDRGSDGFVA